MMSWDLNLDEVKVLFSLQNEERPHDDQWNSVVKLIKADLVDLNNFGFAVLSLEGGMAVDRLRQMDLSEQNQIVRVSFSEEEFAAYLKANI